MTIFMQLCIFTIALLTTLISSAPTTVPNSSPTTPVPEDTEAGGFNASSSTAPPPREAGLGNITITLDNNSTNSDTTTTASTTTSTTPQPTLATTTEVDYSPYDCSDTSRVAQINAAASFNKGLSIAIDDFYGPHIRGLRSRFPNCGRFSGYLLSELNFRDYPCINDEVGLQGLANSIGKIDAYNKLIRGTLEADYNDNMQAFHDILSGIVQDLYSMLSPNYCSSCLVSNDCIEVPTLNTDYFTQNCNFISYIATTIQFELSHIRTLTLEYDQESLPDITTSDWLSAHVQPNSPVYTILGLTA